MKQDDNHESELRCYRCGAGLARLTLPLSRLDNCPACQVDLHVCRMCRHYAPTAPDGCTEDDAETVNEKARANFCDYFRPDPNAFDGSLRAADDQARDQLAALFGEGPDAESGGKPAGDAATAGDADAAQAAGDAGADDQTAAARARADALFDS